MLAKKEIAPWILNDNKRCEKIFKLSLPSDVTSDKFLFQHVILLCEPRLPSITHGRCLFSLFLVYFCLVANKLGESHIKIVTNVLVLLLLVYQFICKEIDKKKNKGWWEIGSMYIVQKMKMWKINNKVIKMSEHLIIIISIMVQIS